MHTIRVTSASATNARLLQKHTHSVHGHETRDKHEQRSRKDDKRLFRAWVAPVTYALTLSGCDAAPVLLDNAVLILIAVAACVALVIDAYHMGEETRRIEHHNQRAENGRAYRGH